MTEDETAAARRRLLRGAILALGGTMMGLIGMLIAGIALLGHYLVTP